MRLLQVFVTDFLVPLQAHYDIRANGVDHSQFKYISDYKTVCRSATICGLSKQRAIQGTSWETGPPSRTQSCICATTQHTTPVVTVITQSLPLIVFSAFHLALPAETVQLLCDCMLTCVGQMWPLFYQPEAWGWLLTLWFMTFSSSNVKYYNSRIFQRAVLQISFTFSFYSKLQLLDSVLDPPHFSSSSRQYHTSKG